MQSSPGRITLWGIEVFVATAEERSITAAARRLGASASAVSQQLTNLETALGVTKGDGSERPASGGRGTQGTRQKRDLTALE